MKTTVYIEGMHCQNCKAKVEKTLSSIEGVKTSKVDLNKGLAVLKTKEALDKKLIYDAVDTLGYQITDIK